MNFRGVGMNKQIYDDYIFSRLLTHKDSRRTINIYILVVVKQNLST